MGQGGIRPGMVVASGTTVSEGPMNGATLHASTGTLLLKFSNPQRASFFGLYQFGSSRQNTALLSAPGGRARKFSQAGDLQIVSS